MSTQTRTRARRKGRAFRVAAFVRGSAQYDVSDSPRRDDGGAWTRS